MLIRIQVTVHDDGSIERFKRFGPLPLEEECPSKIRKHHRGIRLGAGIHTSSEFDRAAIWSLGIGKITSYACDLADLAEPFGSLNFIEIVEYIAGFSSVDPSADMAEPFGTLGFFGVSACLGVFGSGCPRLIKTNTS